MDIIGYADTDVDALSAHDERAADEIEARLSEIQRVADTAVAAEA
jgi:hypothetical protein